MGGNYKLRLLRDLFVNVSSGSVTRRVRILDLVDNPANRFFKRRGIITKGAIVRTEIGLAKITSKPGRDGVLNAVLIEEFGSPS